MAGSKGEPVLVAVDDGYSACKLIAAEPGVGPLLVQSLVRVGRHGEVALDGSTPGGWYETEVAGASRYYTVGDGLQVEETRTDGFHTSDLDRVLVHHALHAAGLAGRRVQLVVGLPAGAFFRPGPGGIRNEDLIAAKRANLRAPVTRYAPDRCPPVEIVDVQVYAQGVSAWVDYALDAQGRVVEDVRGAIGVIDVGGRTTDVAVVIEGQRIDPDRTASDAIGVLDVLDRVADGIRARFGLEQKLPRAMYEAALRTGRITLFGEEHDVSGILSEARAAIEGRLENFLKTVLGRAADLQAVLLVGGGAVFFQEMVARCYRHGRMLEDPVFANARGMCKFALYKEARDAA